MQSVKSIGEVGSLQDIRNVLACHSRGVDRADAGLLSDCYHEDGTVDYRFFAGPAAQFAGILTGAQQGQPVTLHRTAQMAIALDGDRATSESYVMAYVSGPGEQGQTMQRLVCGRYLDRHERRGGRWKMLHRTYVLDTNMNWPGSFAALPLGPLAHHVPAGAQGAADPGIALLSQGHARNRAKGTTSMNQHAPDAASIDAIVSRQQISDLTMAYCRGVDRADAALLAEVFHDDSTVVSGAFNGNGKTFAAEICRIVEEAFEQTFHSVANHWVEVDGDGAVGETYVIACSTSRGEGERTDMLTGGRYIDRFERRDGTWRIAERTFVMDWARSEPSTRQMDGPFYGALDLRGCRGSGDPVYAFTRG